MKDKKKNILLVLIFFVAYVAIWKLIPSFSNNEYLDLLIAYSIMAPILIGMLLLVKKVHILKFEGKKFIHGIGCGWIYVLIATAVIILNIKSQYFVNEMPFQPILNILCYIVALQIGTGFCEEVLFRGFIQNLMYDTFGKDTKKGIVLSIIVSAIFFGLIHLGNIPATGWAAVGQCIQTTGMGLFMGAVYARSKSIWSVIFLHGFWDVCFASNNGLFGIGQLLNPLEGNIATIIGTIIGALFICGLYVISFIVILRKEKEVEYLETNN